MSKDDEAAKERLLRAQWAAWVADHCTCTWPLVVYRNGSGHRDDCPVNAKYRDKKP